MCTHTRNLKTDRPLSTKVCVCVRKRGKKIEEASFLVPIFDVWCIDFGSFLSWLFINCLLFFFLVAYQFLFCLSGVCGNYQSVFLTVASGDMYVLLSLLPAQRVNWGWLSECGGLVSFSLFFLRHVRTRWLNSSSSSLHGWLFQICSITRGPRSGGRTEVQSISPVMRLWGGKSYCVCVSMSGTTIVKGRFAQKIDMHTLRIHFPPASNYFFHHTHAHSITSHKTLSTPKDQSVTEIWHKQLFPSACEENPGRSSHRQSRDATDLAKSDDFRLFFSLCPTNVQLRS